MGEPVLHQVAELPPVRAEVTEHRLLEPLGYVPPAVFEEQLFRTRAAPTPVGALN